MRTTFALLSAALLVSVSVVTASRQAQPASTHSVNVEEAMKAFRADLQASRADIIAKNVQLTAEQAAKFWPLFERYQKEQSAIIDGQLKGFSSTPRNTRSWTMPRRCRWSRRISNATAG